MPDTDTVMLQVVYTHVSNSFFIQENLACNLGTSYLYTRIINWLCWLIYWSFLRWKLCQLDTELDWSRKTLFLPSLRWFGQAELAIHLWIEVETFYCLSHCPQLQIIINKINDKNLGSFFNKVQQEENLSFSLLPFVIALKFLVHTAHSYLFVPTKM